MIPLNGTKTHPLKESSLSVLRQLKWRKIPCAELNPGVINRLKREGLVVVVDHKSPYKTHKGGVCNHLALSDEGVTFVERLLKDNENQKY